MSTAWSQWCLLSFVRLYDSGTEQNNTLRIDYDVGAGTVSVTVEVAAGVYVLGINGYGDSNSLEVGAWAGDPTDVDLFGTNSLLRALTLVINAKLSSIQSNMGLETLSSIGGNQVASGKIIVSLNGTGSHSLDFKWTHAETLMDPAWFGMAKTSGVYATTTSCPGNAETVISDMSSTLALVGQSVLGAEPQYEGYLDVGVMAGDGSSRWKRFGVGYEQISGFRVKVDGLPRDSVDSGFHSLRRWARQLVFNRARKRFIYIPDLQRPSSGYPREWDPDDTEEEYRWGWRDMAVDALRGFRFEDIRKFANSNRIWELTVPVRSYIS